MVLSKTAYAGNTFSEEEIKTLPLDEIMKASGNRDGMAKQNLKVASGATIPFMVVFAEMPDDLSEFTVEAVSSIARELIVGDKAGVESVISSSGFRSIVRALFCFPAAVHRDGGLSIVIEGCLCSKPYTWLKFRCGISSEGGSWG